MTYFRLIRAHYDRLRFTSRMPYKQTPYESLFAPYEQLNNVFLRHTYDHRMNMAILEWSPLKNPRNSCVVLTMFLGHAYDRHRMRGFLEAFVKILDKTIDLATNLRTVYEQ